MERERKSDANATQTNIPFVAARAEAKKEKVKEKSAICSIIFSCSARVEWRRRCFALLCSAGSAYLLFSRCQSTLACSLYTPSMALKRCSSALQMRLDSIVKRRLNGGDVGRGSGRASARRRNGSKEVQTTEGAEPNHWQRCKKITYAVCSACL